MFINIESLTITLAQGRERPGVRMSDTDFINGYHDGLREATQGINAGVPLTDDEIMESLKAIVDENGFTNGHHTHTWYGVGSLIGRITGRW